MATANPIGLPQGGKTLEARETGARIFANYADTGSRVVMVLVMAALFVWLNYSVVTFISTVFSTEAELLKAAPHATRVVTTEVLLGLLGATVVQGGAAIIAVVSYLFQKQR